MKQIMETFAFIDASNFFYGGEKSLGWKIDYQKLERFGYKLFLKPVKLYEQEDGTTRRKANRDVELAFHLMKEKNNFDRVVVLSGDGDFLPVLKYLRDSGKELIILARGPRTAKEIRQFAGPNFRDFEYLKYRIKIN